MQELVLQELASLASKAMPRPRVRGAPGAATTLQAFTPTSLGGFPYFWQDPRSLEFNPRTYSWIASSLRANANPAELDASFFVNYYIQVLSQIDYSLSSSDAAKLLAAGQSISTAQVALLSAWKAAFGSLPRATGGGQPIDLIVKTITTEWATPPTTLAALRQTADLNAALNSAPASQKAQILPALPAYIQALGAADLANAVPMNRGLLARALEAAQYPSLVNGGLRTSDLLMNPAYSIRPSVSKILADLNSPDQLSVVIDASRSDSQFSVSLNGGVNQSVPELDFLRMEPPESTFDLGAYVSANQQQPVRIEMVFQGLALVDFGPVPFDPATGRSWFWTAPIRDAIRNTGQDVSGFRFAQKPAVDFTKEGPFGFVTRVGLSRYPSIAVKAANAPENPVQQRMLAGSASRVTVANQGPSEGYGISSGVDAESGLFTVRFDPPADPGTINSTAFVVGVNTFYPAA